ncbi:hypothetical protein PY365_04275 [Roseiarcaceae bacterium H3SJ34-1]|uniref:hypothetical protein n=1 Tax=Terripilifer ovatus TaxID=3032367 RepID=UPI003AB91CB8|nr:hypothetical protein [Roseiarcaceae bacterium H3SJ34-1]
MHEDTRERVVALERDVKHLSAQMDDMNQKVSEMHALLMQAKGARWAMLTLVGIGGFLAGKVGGLISLFGVR